MINTTVDVKRIWDTVMTRRAVREKERLTPPWPRLWDGNMNLRGEIAGERAGSFEFVENDTGIAQIKLSLDHYLAKWVMNHKGRAKRNVILTIDKQGARWSGMMDHYKVISQENGDRWLEVNFKSDYEHWHHIRVWSNPFAGAPARLGGGTGEDLDSSLRNSNFRKSGSFSGLLNGASS